MTQTEKHLHDYIENKIRSDSELNQILEDYEKK